MIAPFLMLALSVAQVPPYSETGKLTDGPPSGPSKWYRDLVERYLTGDREGAIAEEFPPEKALYEINAVIDETAGTESGRITSLNPSAKKPKA